MDAIIEARRLVEDAFMPLLIALLYISAVQAVGNESSSVLVALAAAN